MRSHSPKHLPSTTFPTNITPQASERQDYGCGKHYDVFDENNNLSPKTYIFFDADVAATKGTLVTGETLPSEAGTAFGVLGFRPSGADVFDRYKAGDNSAFDNVARVYRPTGSSSTNVLSFTYDGLAGWFPGEHTFYAYYPYEATPTVLPSLGSDENGYYMTYVQPTALDDMADVMTATVTSAPTAGGVVNLNFSHRLFALDVKLNSESQAPLNFTTAQVQFTNVATKANLYFVDGTDTDQYPDFDAIETGSISKAFINSSTILSAGESINFTENNSFLLLPDAALTIKFTLSFTNVWGQDVDFETEYVSNGTFEPGKKYELTIKRKDNNGDEIIFDPSLRLIRGEDGTGNDWDTPDADIDHEFN